MARSNLLSVLLYGKNSWIFSEDCGTKGNKYSSTGEHKKVLYIRTRDRPVTFNQCVSYFDSFKL